MSPTPDLRSSSRLSALGAPFDVLVIGGGITGAGIARDAALRGLRVALVEKDDFASGTSSRSSRLIHGGLRYLEHGYLKLVFEASAERRRLLRLAPHLVRPLPFVWPVYEGARVPRWRLAAGLTMYDALALFRNVAKHQRLGRDEVLEREPALDAEGLVGGAVYYDAATNDARLTLVNVFSAVEAGAVVVNHAQVRSLVFEGDAVRGAVVYDTLSGESVRVAARTVVNAAGPWNDEIRRMEDPAAPGSVRGTKGVHILLPSARVGARGALTLLSSVDRRVMFVLPGGDGFSIIGTTDTVSDEDPDEVRASEDDIAYLLDSANGFFPGVHLTRDDVVSAWAGIRPLIASGFDEDDENPASASREHLVAWTPRGVLGVSGGKLTTYRVMASETVDRVMQRLGRRAGRSPTRTEPLPGGDMASVDEETATAARRIGDERVAAHLAGTYGSRWPAVWSLAEENAALARRITDGRPYIHAELVHGVRCELALTLADLLIRRTFLAFETRDNARSVASEAARTVAPHLGWGQADIAREVERYARDVSRMFGVGTGSGRMGEPAGETG